MHAIERHSRLSVDSIRMLIAWPGRTSVEWYKGFLAGIFDAEGSFGSGVIRITNTDPAIIDWTTFACGRLGLPFVVENVREGMWNVRIRGGLEQQLRFHHLTNPAITRKRSIEGRAVKSQSRLKVVSIEPLGMELPLYDITTGTGDFIANGVVSHNCFARPTHEYLDFDAGRDFEKEIVVKVNVPEVLRKELGAAVVEARAHRDGHEHRPVPVGRGALQADARDLGGAARRREPVLDPDEVAAAAARPGPDARGRGAHGDQRVPVGADARREGVAGERAAHAASAGAAGGGRRAQPRPGSRRAS